MKRLFCCLLCTLMVLVLAFSSVFLIVGYNKLKSPISLTVGSYNIMIGKLADYDMSKYAQNIVSSHLDIVGLQEVDQCTQRVNGKDTMKELSEESGYPYYAFFKALAFQGGEYGIGIMSKYPIVSTKVIMLESGGMEQRVLGYAEIDVNGHTVHFFVTHLSFESKQIRDRQFEQIANELKKYDDFILVGDFNTRDFDSYDIIEGANTVNNHEENVVTFPETNASIDNIVFHNGNWDFSSPQHITDQSYSDHYMLYTTGTYVGERSLDFSDVWQDISKKLNDLITS